MISFNGLLRYVLYVVAVAGSVDVRAQKDSLAGLLAGNHDTRLQETGRGKDTAGVRIQEIRFAAGGAQTATALLAKLRTAKSPFSLVLFLHWGGGQKEDFREEALRFARQGFYAISVDAPWHWPTWDSAAGFLRTYPDGIINSVKAFRSLISWAARQKGFSGKTYFIGHSYGATLGGLLVGVEPRIRGAVMMAGLSSVSHSIEEDPKGFWTATKNTERPLLDSVLARLRIMEPEDFINRSSAVIFHQVATRDEIVTKEQSERYLGRTKNKVRAVWYDTDHRFVNEAAAKDRLAWILQLDKGRR